MTSSRHGLGTGIRKEPADRSVSTARRVTFALAFAGLMTSMAQTALLPLVPQLPRLLHTSPSGAAWAVTAALIAGAVSNPIVGRLADMFGKRRVLLWTLAALFAGSLLCAAAHTLPLVIAGRAIQGCALAAIPVGISILRDVLPTARVGTAAAVMSSMVGVGGALALPAAALLIQGADWHLLYWAFSGLSVAALVAVWIAVPPSPHSKSASRMDTGGAAGLAVSLVALLLAVSQGGAWGWTSPPTYGLFLVAAVVLAWWGRWEWRRPDPLVDLRVSSGRQVLVTNVTAILMGFATYAVAYSMSQLLQLPRGTHYGLGLSTLAACLCLAPSGIAMLLSSPLSARLSTRLGARTTLAAGCAVTALGWMLSLLLMHAAWKLVVTSCVIGIGVGLAYAAMPLLVMAAVPASQTASANGLNALTRSLGTSSAGAVLGMIMTSQVTTFHGSPVPSEGAFHTVFLIAFAAALIATTTALLLPRTTHPHGRQAHRPHQNTRVADAHGLDRTPKTRWSRTRLPTAGLSNDRCDAGDVS
ncbi:MFS transporter [Actinacidiphila glaucinigra]|uniref:MFS transporter n=1 Tax=Actinacidiphila glaucinigra TaxID=235986 RepID=UPI002DDA550C|nr:MFS transporter [Actinacidiphila glaucinigra]WSD64790.1 MFS transporter [Actinacidiphila glaucinigra]